MSNTKSEIADIFGSEIYGGIPRQSSRCKIIIYSHIDDRKVDASAEAGVVDCSADVISCETSKTIKSGGGASFILVPRINYLNYIFPNDYVHIYFDPGDGRGFIRVFFGFVDRIERTIQTESNGQTHTKFFIKCSDFTKAFDVTNIYFNPQVADRGDFVSQFFKGTDMISGTALRTKGISIQGTPADIVTSLIYLILGFGSQFSIPRSHPKDQALVDLSRKQRIKNIMSPLFSEYQEMYGKDELKRIKENVEARYKALQNQTVDSFSDRMTTMEKVLANTGVGLGQQPKLTPELAEIILSKTALQYEWVNTDQYERALAVQDTIYKYDHTLLDLIDFSYVEYGAIDGSVLSKSIWTSQGPLWSIMNAWSNDQINELFCDLRLVGEDQKFDLAAGGYSRKSDEIGGNSGGGIRTVPALIMREYPFSTVEGVLPPGKVQILGERLGAIPLGGITYDGRGAIFSQEPGISGRKTSKIKTLNPFRLVETGGKEMALKHLDVAAISVTDIISETIGRSDADTVNLIEVYADMGIGYHLKYMANEIQPIATPISVARDGLRVRTYTTKFARWPTNKYKKLIASLDSYPVRFQTVRWTILLDHWYQHNKEYLNGTITTRAFPEIRVGYRLDIKERKESYYVEGVNHSWNYTEQGAILTSSFTLSRGQRNDPYPVYVTPSLQGWGGVTNRDNRSRLAYYFDQVDPSAVARASVLFGGKQTDNVDLENLADIPSKANEWSNNEKGYLAAASSNLSMQMKKEEAEKRKRAWVDTSTAGMLESLNIGSSTTPTGKTVKR